MILLDTHVLVKFMNGGPSLGRAARELIEQATDAHPLLVSAITGWELAMLSEKGRIDLGRPTSDWFEEATSHSGLKTIAIEADVAIEAGNPPIEIHRDPADRILITTARLLEVSLLTADRKILAYAAAGHLQAIDARR